MSWIADAIGGFISEMLVHGGHAVGRRHAESLRRQKPKSDEYELVATYPDDSEKEEGGETKPTTQ